MARAQGKITDAIADFTEEQGLTAMEWVNVLQMVQDRMIAEGLIEEWTEGDKP